MERATWSRWRWRLRGAWQWPAFALATVADAILLDVLPVWGDGPDSFVASLLLAACLNLVVVAVLAPLAGRLLRLRRRDLPRAIAKDYAGTALLGALLASLAAAGLDHRADLARDRAARSVQALAVARFVHAREPDYVPGLPGMDTVRLEEGMYRTCVPATGPARPLCLFVRTDQRPPAVTRDGDREPNAVYRARGGFE